MVFNDFSQKTIKNRLKKLYLAIGEDIKAYDKEIEEMKTIEKQEIEKEKSVSTLKENINFAEESLYENIISNIEIDAALAILSKNFDLISITPGKNQTYSLMIFKKNGIDITLQISPQTQALIEENLKS